MQFASVWVIGLVTLLFVIYLARDVLSRDMGTPKMQEIGNMIFEGAMAFLKRQYRTITLLSLPTALIIGLVIWGVEKDVSLAVRTALGFLLGAGCSAIAGFIGMYVSVRSNVRTASAAQRSAQEAITVAMRGGAVSGLLVVTLSLLGVAAIFTLYGGLTNPAEAPFLIVGFGFGASFVALFAQLGGGIYTKAADMGADLVGKIEAGIPEDDPRNAAVIADLVGDNVGDCAGRGADLFESTAGENIGAMILGVAIYAATKNPDWILFPLVIRAVGLIASILGVLSVRGHEDEDPMRALDRGYYVTAGVAALGMIGVGMSMLGSIWFVYAGLVGIATSIAFVYITQYYTATHWRPVRDIARASVTGPATNIVAGVAVGFECTASTAIVVSGALLASFWFGAQSGQPHGGLFGTAVATMGMLMSCAYILAMDTFGPITDNAGGITQMGGAPERARKITDTLDAVGNTTKALTKGYAIGSAALAAFLLFSAYLEKVTTLTGKPFDTVNLAKVEVFVGGLLGAMLVFLFSSLAIRAVGRAAGGIIEEVRRQFKSDPGIMAGTSRPDYAHCVDITTGAALREMILPGVLAVTFPILIGVVLGAEAAAAMLMVGTISGVILATVLNNAGGAWDNAKKFIEAGNLHLVLDERTKAAILAATPIAGSSHNPGNPSHSESTGKAAGVPKEIHDAAVVGDTVGDPFKDTAGPSLHVLVKLLATLTLVFSPLFVR
ncbi:MAG: sodium-translocating pyrophosphatase [Chloroflexi bacterium]|nr:sodium-translocating pyrophosphatase [Chloroflexota bacterium]